MVPFPAPALSGTASPTGRFGGRLPFVHGMFLISAVAIAILAFCVSNHDRGNVMSDERVSGGAGRDGKFVT